MTLAVLALSSVAVTMNNVLGQVLVSRSGILSRFLFDVFLSVGPRLDVVVLNSADISISAWP